MSMTELDPARWQHLWQALGAEPPVEALQRLQHLYAEPGRHYHTATHINACLHSLDELRAEAGHAQQVELAIWYHDAIYDPARQDNEARSADLAADVLQAAGLAAHVETVCGLIMATDHRQPCSTPDQQLLVDIDLSILAAPASDYAAYARAVRLEYARFPDALYRPGRLAVLQKFLQRPAIFASRAGQARWEMRARVNLQAEIAGLQAGLNAAPGEDASRS